MKARIPTSSVRLEFPRFHRPEFADKLIFPKDVSVLSGQEISRLHTGYTQMFAFANQELADTEVRILDFQGKLSRKRNLLMVRQPGLNTQERWRRDAVLDCDPDVMEMERELNLAKMRKAQVVLYKENYDRFLACLSRELSRKSAEQGRY